MEKSECSKIATHILVLQGERFPIYHKERRLYGFVNWKDSREKLIKIMLAVIENKTGESTAFIDFKMANPMRKTRLGNFFIDLQADVMVQRKSICTLEELGMKNILIDSFETLDLNEVEIRLKKEAKYSEEHYNTEFRKRLAKVFNQSDINFNQLADFPVDLKNQIVKSMKEEGWSWTIDNRFFARNNRLAVV